MEISPASVHDIHDLKDIRAQLKDRTLIGDKGYLSAEYQLDLLEACKIRLDTPMRNNQRNYRKQAYIQKMDRDPVHGLATSS